MPCGVFLDRDGVINKLVYHEKTGEYEPPHSIDEFQFYPWVIDSLKRLIGMGFQLFLVSNQPDCAKGKTSFENLQSVQDHLESVLTDNGIVFKEYCYCYHHPRGIVREYAVECECRKPKPFFVLNAMVKYKLETENSWFIGDRDSDIKCGRNAGVRTILIENPDSKLYRGNSNPDFVAANIKEAVTIIEKQIKETEL
jgi:D-glycero-D-manno-heptose 1,7-bisphosphate phosphatase